MSRKGSHDTPIILGSSVYLRPPKKAELGYIHKLWTDPSTMKEVGGPVVFNDEQLDAWYRAMVNPGGMTDFYCLIFNKLHEPVGEISFHHYNIEDGTATLNVKVEAEQRGKGYAHDALELMLHYFFYRWGGKVIVDDLAKDNIPGQQALLKFGFETVPTDEDVFRVQMTLDKFSELYDEYQ